MLLPKYSNLARVFMKKYKILEHSADLKIQVWGKDREELFCNAVIAMFESIEPEVSSPEKRETSIKIDAENEDMLLIDFLNEALYQSDVNNETYDEVEILKLEPMHVEAKLMGREVKGFKEEIKAVTYHGFDIKKTEQGLEAEIIFDI